MTTQTPVFTINLDCKPLSEFTAELETELRKHRIEAQKRHLVGRWRQKTLAARIRSMEQMGALAWLRIINEDARKNGIH